MKRASVISLGCPRNLLDSEIIAGSLKKSGYRMCGSEEDVDLCVVNTCAFIEPARIESVDEIVRAASRKKEGRIGALVVCGCLPQLYKKRLSRELDEADLILGTSDFARLPGLLKKISRGGAGRSFISRSLNYLYDEDDPRLRLTPRHYAYVKVSEGCSNACSYCIISRLRGKFRSRPEESIVNEVKRISASGSLKEIDIIGQDTTLYGLDRYGRIRFAELLRRLCRIKNNVRWFRILYTHPAHYTADLIDAVREEPRICKYLDIPIQHASDRILKRMNRRTSKKDIETLIGDIRENIPGVVLRTSMIVGFPGETDREFNQMLDFVRKTRFERLGAFIYSRENGTRASRFDKQVPEDLKRQRLDTLMKAQQKISASINKSLIGKVVEVLIDDKDTGRTAGDAPEIDGVVHVRGSRIRAGEFRRVRIVDALEYDLIGEVAGGAG